MVNAPAVVRCMMVLSLTGHVSGESGRWPRVSLVCSPSWTLFPEALLSLWAFLCPSASPTAPSSIAALNFSIAEAAPLAVWPPHAQPWCFTAVAFSAPQPPPRIVVTVPLGGAPNGQARPFRLGRWHQ